MPSKPTMLEKNPHVAGAVARIRAGEPFQLPPCGVCGKRNVLEVDVNPADERLPFGFVRRCECLYGEDGTVSMVSEDAVVGMVRRLVVPDPNASLPAPAFPESAAPADDATRPNTAHLFFAVDTVCCAVCGGEEPFSIPPRTPFPTLLRALRVISDRHPATPHALSASL